MSDHYATTPDPSKAKPSKPVPSASHTASQMPPAGHWTTRPNPPARPDSDRDFGKGSGMSTATQSCSCGGPGGRPGMAPICWACLQFSFIGERVALRQRPANPLAAGILSRFTLQRQKGGV